MSGSGTGTPITSSGATLADLRAAIRLNLASATDWPDATLNGYIADAIRAYSNEFPRRLTHTIACVTGTQAYDLPGGHNLLNVSAVEYPAGQTPPAFLLYAGEETAAYAAAGDVYTLRNVADSETATTDDNAGQIVLAPAVATGETIKLTYTALHRIPSADGDLLTVPANHWEALVAFVDFRGHWQLSASEAAAITTNSIALSQLSAVARMAWNRYKEIIDRIAWHNRGNSAPVVWDNARIY